MQEGREAGLRNILRYILPLGLIVLSAAVVYGLVQIAKHKRPERKAVETQAMVVEAMQAELTSLKLSVFSQGSVKPRTETTVVAEVSGKIVDVSPNFIAGGFFRDGEVLLQIDPSDYEAALKRAQANLASRKAQYADQKARSEQAMKDWQNLGRQGTPSDLTLRKPQLAEALANVQAAEAELQKAQRDLQRTRISVPYDGLVRNKKADIGQYVAPGTPLGVTFAIDSAEIRLPLSATDVSFLDLPSATNPENKQFPRVTLRSDTAGISGEWQAEIIRTEGVVDEKSRVTYAVARVIDPYRVLGLSDQSELRVGTFVRAEIEGVHVDDVVVLPRSVLGSDNTVLVANENNELEIRQVSLIRAEPKRIFISDGLKSGEWVITTLLDAPIPGTRVAVNGQDKPSPGLKGGDDSVAVSMGAEQ
jgi:RND family efflux transporter MFP subunit